MLRSPAPTQKTSPPARSHAAPPLAAAPRARGQPPAGRWRAVRGDGSEGAENNVAPPPTPPAAYGLPGSRELGPDDLPTQGQSLVSPQRGAAVLDRERDGGGSGSFDLSYLAELMAIQQSGPRNLGFFGTRNMGYLHQQLIEILAYAYVLTENHIFTSGATGTNAAVIRGALRAERPDLLTVVLPQSLARQPGESRELLAKVANVVETPENDGLALGEAARACNEEILRRVQQVICFAFHDSELLLETCQRAKAMQKPVALLFLD